MPADAVFRAVCVVPGSHFACRHLTLDSYQIIPRVRTAELVVQYKVGRMHIRVIRRHKTALSLTLVQFELAVLYQIRSLNSHLPLAKLTGVLVTTVYTRRHRRIQFAVYKLHGLVRCDGFLLIQKVQRVLVRYTEGVNCIVILHRVAGAHGRTDSRLPLRRVKGPLPLLGNVFQLGKVLAVCLLRRHVAVFAGERSFDLGKKLLQAVQQLLRRRPVFLGELGKQVCVVQHITGEVRRKLVHHLVTRQRHALLLRRLHVPLHDLRLCVRAVFAHLVLHRRLPELPVFSGGQVLHPVGDLMCGHVQKRLVAVSGDLDEILLFDVLAVGSAAIPRCPRALPACGWRPGTSSCAMPI